MGYLENKTKTFVVAAVTLCSFFGGNLFFTAMADTGNQAGALNSIIITVKANPVIVNLGGHTTLTVTIADNSSSPSFPTGTVLWSSGSAGGTFNPSSCTLASGTCTTSYIPSSSSPNAVTITASYAGDVAHHGGSNSSQITTNVIRPTTTTVMPNQALVSTGSSVSFTVQVADTTSLPTTPNGTVSWTSGSAGGTFNPASCTLASGTCSTSFTPSLNSPTTATITATYTGDSTHSGSAGISALTVNVLHSTTTSIIQNPSTVSSGGSIFVVKVNDTSSSKTTPTGTVSWTDGNAAGSFNATSCTLSSRACVFSYTPNANAPNVVTINATYSGDGTHMPSSGAFKLSTNELSGTTLTVTPNPATSASGNAVTFTATVADTSHPSAALIGIVSWSDNGAGGTFSPNDCALSSNHCTLLYTSHSNPSSMITITATYVGDSTHSGSSGTSSLSTSSANVSQPTNSTSIPQWVRNNAKWWHENAIGDGDFEKGIQYLIQQGIMKIPSTQSGTSTSQQIPSWIKNNAGWWASGQISDDEFVKGIQYLIQKGIIKV